jgi:hypothetical protein
MTQNDGHVDPTSAFGKLRDEIVETQKSRLALLKWKLVVVSALGAAGLGFSNKDRQLLLLLALIPPVCVYVDLLCHHLWLRVQVIGRFIAHFQPGHDEPLSRYERFIEQLRAAQIAAAGQSKGHIVDAIVGMWKYMTTARTQPHGIFDFHDWALGSSTYLASAVVVATLFAAPDWTTRCVLVLAGLAGWVLTFFRNAVFWQRLDLIWQQAEGLLAPASPAASGLRSEQSP